MTAEPDGSLQARTPGFRRAFYSGNGLADPDHDGSPIVHTPILPPPRLVIATTEGRTGMSGLKSGQRVERSS